MIRAAPSSQQYLPPAKRQKLDSNGTTSQYLQREFTTPAIFSPQSGVHPHVPRGVLPIYPPHHQQQHLQPQQLPAHLPTISAMILSAAQQHLQQQPQQQHLQPQQRPMNRLTQSAPPASISNATKELIQNLGPPTIPKPSTTNVHHENDVWFWDRSGRGTDFQPFASSVNKEIVEGYMQRKPKITVSFNSRQYEIYFIAMVQRNCSSGTQRLLTCLSAVHYSIPRWVPLFPNNDEKRRNFQLIAMSSEDYEYKETTTFFMETMPTASVVSVQKVENRFLRKAWEFAREQVCEKSGKSDQVKLLFHGSRTTNPLVICNSDQGFLPQCAGVGMWGPGSYFSEKSAYSDRYSYRLTPQEIQQEFPSYDSTSNLRQILLCEVIVGDSCYSFPNKMLRIPPQKKTPSSSPLNFAVDRYDSVWGITYGTKVYITYNTTRAYPTYLITYRDSFS